MFYISVSFHFGIRDSPSNNSSLSSIFFHTLLLCRQIAACHSERIAPADNGNVSVRACKNTTTRRENLHNPSKKSSLLSAPLHFARFVSVSVLVCNQCD